jgi:AcrR family transcriptional regulator
MSIAERRERERTDTREKILDAARELFITEGYDGVSMRKVAQKIDYSPTAIYVHFPDKEALFLELCHADFQRLAGSFVKLAEIQDPIERIRQIGRAYIQFGIENPNHYRMMFMTNHPQLNDPQEDKGNPEKDAYAFLKMTVEEALRAGAFRSDLTDADLIAQTLWAGTHGVVSLEIANGDENWVPWSSFEKRVDLMLDGLFAGLLRKDS